ncbi:gamma-mobile-trio recombinase GmtY [Aromatoleum petrolei]|uniref:Tyrosine-type recombinase/integrase n=1 Tax=Aromatoleum petrolei TaxID=76116 RepID=A0ABX1MXB2_9RHOO|nr:gamma-mobile-trio recombinase GmtY [Aromatoleum petrolei]NMF90941.1 tyrosine-type recombinase/integrase [Aromatoleum petrolei]QTQ35975.1 Putative integrase, phage related [Aromatoleum petrolei]
MTHTVVRYKVVRDNTGIHEEIPVILTEFGPLQPLIKYVLRQRHLMSESSIDKLVQAVGLLIDYTEANHQSFDDPKELFEVFVQRLYSGTVGVDGNDPSDLYWDARSPAVVRVLVNHLSKFSDWMAQEQGTTPLNPWRQATRAEERLAWAAWHHQRSRAFLSHTMSVDVASLKVSRARTALLKNTPVIDHGPVKYFPQDRMHDLLFRGFIVPGKQRSPRVEERLNLRDILITMLLHYGGLRMSEPFHLYVHDVIHDDTDPGCALVRVFHPSYGQAPADLFDAKGKPVACDRATYLRDRYGLPPRTEYKSTHTLHAGWKGNALDSKRHFMDVHWVPRWAGRLFWKLWVFYMAQRDQHTPDHPYAFVTREGKPYSIDAFEDAHAKAVRRIGLVPAKAAGTTPHGHRHAYGQRLSDLHLDATFLKKALHHKSLESQVVYTEPDRVKLNRAIDAALARAEKAEDGTAPPPPDFLAYGFKDVDPLGLLSGPNRRLLRRS